MDRRHFVALLSGGVFATLDLDRLRWVPGARTIVLPPSGGWSDAQYWDSVAKEFLRTFSPGGDGSWLGS